MVMFIHSRFVLGFFACAVALLAAGTVSAEDAPGLDSGLPLVIEDGGYFFSRTVDMPYDEAVARVREDLEKEGFGILTEIDVKATLKNKPDVDFPPYIILGACNPPFALKAPETDDWIGGLMPCNAVARVPADGQVRCCAM